MVSALACFPGVESSNRSVFLMLMPGQHTVTVLARDAMAKMNQASTNFWVVSCSMEIIPPSNRLALSGCACSLSDDAIGVSDGLISVSL